MIKPIKCNARNLLFGFIVFVVCWQFIGLSKKPSKVKQTSSNIKVTFKCNCNRTQKKFANESNSTVPPGGFRWCSGDSTARGAHQKVIAYSLFGTGTKENVSAVSNRYDSLLRKILIAA
jgi:hypothetical protein